MRILTYWILAVGLAAGPAAAQAGQAPAEASRAPAPATSPPAAPMPVPPAPVADAPAPPADTPAPAAESGPPPAGTYLVHAIDVGTGLAIFVEGHDFSLLYDAGSNDDAGRGEKNRVVAYLAAVRPDLRRIDHLVVSHPHKDHHEMLDDVFVRYEVGSVWDSGSIHTSCGYRVYLEAIVDEPGVAYHNAAGSGGTHDARFGAASCRGQSFPAATVKVPRSSMISSAPVALGAGASMTILHADSTKRDPHLNDASVVARLDLGPKRILLPGDAEAGGERNPPTVPPTADSVEGKLLICCTPDLRSDVLVAAHHGSKTSSRNTFLDAVGASHFVISSGPKKYSGTQLPSVEVVDELTRRAAAAGGVLWRTDIDDDACKANAAKIGPDEDDKPGGCDNVRFVIDPAGEMVVDYFRRAD